jgi:hypothetical protein
MISQPNPVAHTWNPSQGIQRLRKEFDRYGFILLNGIKAPEEFLEQLGGLGRIYHHRDSLPNGLTQIKQTSNWGHR